MTFTHTSVYVQLLGFAVLAYSSPVCPGDETTTTSQSSGRVIGFDSARRARALEQAFERSKEIDRRYTERRYCSHPNCWQKATACLLHKQTHLRLLPPQLLDNISQFLGAPSNIEHQINLVPAGNVRWRTLSSNATATYSQFVLMSKLLTLTLTNQGTSEYRKENPDKYPQILCCMQPYVITMLELQRLSNFQLSVSYDPIKNTGSIYSIITTLGETNNAHEIGKIIPLHGGFLARYVTLRQLGISMQTAQRYNCMKSDLPKTPDTRVARFTRRPRIMQGVPDQEEKED